MVSLWLCWTSERPQQRSPTPTLVKNTPAKKGKNVKKEIEKGIKKEIKQEFKKEIKPEPPCTPTLAGKRPCAISGEMSIRRKRWQKELDSLGPVDDAGKLESFE